MRGRRAGCVVRMRVNALKMEVFFVLTLADFCNGKGATLVLVPNEANKVGGAKCAHSD